MKTRRHKTSCRHKHKSSCRHSFSKTVRKRMLSKRKHSNSMRKRTKRKHNKKRKGANVYRGGNGAQYPAVYGIENKSVLYPISPNGITAGLPDPPIPSNGPNGNGPIGRDIVSGESMSGKGMYLGSGGGSQSTLAPQSLVNLTRSLTGGVTEIFNGFGGYTNSDSLNPMPYSQPIDQNVKYIRSNYPDLGKSYNNMDEKVSNL